MFSGLHAIARLNKHKRSGPDIPPAVAMSAIKQPKIITDAAVRTPPPVISFGAPSASNVHFDAASQSVSTTSPSACDRPQLSACAITSPFSKPPNMVASSSHMAASASAPACHVEMPQYSRDGRPVWYEDPRLGPGCPAELTRPQQKAYRELESWMQGRCARAPSGPRICILSGPVGAGKRMLAHVAATQCGRQCIAPETYHLSDIVRIIERDAGSRALHMPGTRKINMAWLFTSLDGCIRADEACSTVSPADTARLLEQMITAVDAHGAACPPIVFTLHEFYGRGLQALKKKRDVLKIIWVNATTDSADIRTITARVCARAGTCLKFFTFSLYRNRR